MQTAHHVHNDLAPIPFDRRHGDRWPIDDVHATAFVLGGGRFGDMVNLKLTDGCEGGLGALIDCPLNPGTPVSLGFDRPGMFACRAEVVRCVPCGDGYRIGLRYQGRLAA